MTTSSLGYTIIEATDVAAWRKFGTDVLGLVATDLKRDYAQTLYVDLGSVDPLRVAATFAAMERAGAAVLEAAEPAAVSAITGGVK